LGSNDGQLELGGPLAGNAASVDAGRRKRRIPNQHTFAEKTAATSVNQRLLRPLFCSTGPRTPVAAIPMKTMVASTAAPLTPSKLGGRRIIHKRHQHTGKQSDRPANEIGHDDQKDEEATLIGKRRRCPIEQIRRDVGEPECDTDDQRPKNQGNNDRRKEADNRKGFHPARQSL
jgi:hypothetical protein